MNTRITFPDGITMNYYRITATSGAKLRPQAKLRRRQEAILRRLCPPKPRAIGAKVDVRSQMTFLPPRLTSSFGQASRSLPFPSFALRPLLPSYCQFLKTDLKGFTSLNISLVLSVIISAVPVISLINPRSYP